MNKILAFFSWIFLNLLFASIELIFLITVFDNAFVLRKYFHYFFTALFLANTFILSFLKPHFSLSKLKMPRLLFNWPIGLLGIVIIVYRALTYAHAIDDFVFHMPHGYFSLTVWKGIDFMPTTADYIYPLLQMIYYFFIDIIGIRLTLIILGLFQLAWFLNLNERYKYLLFGKYINKYLYVNLLFLIIFFLPELMISHVTFMSDFYKVILSLEVLYVFLSKKNIILGYLLIPVTILTKQSLGFMLIPIFLVFFIKNIKHFKEKNFLLPVLVFYLLIVIFPVKSFFEIGNPIGLLFNNIFKSPLAPYLSPRLADFRWGPRNIVETIYWPFISLFSGRYIEFLNVNKLIYAILPLFLGVPYIFALIQIMRKKQVSLNLVIFIYILFWSWQSGYGRYQVALYSLIWIFILKQTKNLLFPLKNFIIFNLLLFFISAILFTDIRNDYGMRNFIFERFFPPKLLSYSIQLFKGGIKLIGKDKFSDVFWHIRDNYNDFNGIVVLNRGVSTFYALLGSKYKHLPVYSYVTDKDYERIIHSQSISTNIKNTLIKFKEKKRLLVLTVKDFPENVIYTTDISKHYTCSVITRNKLVPQFQHDNYFNYVREYNCVK